MQLLNPPPARLVLLVVDDGVAFDPPSAEVVHCASQEEALAALDAGRRYSAVVASAAAPPLVAAARQAGIPLLGAEPAFSFLGTGEGCLRSGAQAADSPDGSAWCSRGGAQVGAPIARVDIGPSLGPAPAPAPAGIGACGGTPDEAAGRLVAVCGPGGTGASVLAAALAVYPLVRAEASRAKVVPAVGRAGPAQALLADLARRADQAFLHGLGDAVGGLLDLVERARYRQIGPEDVRPHTVAIPGARLLPGLRRPHHWTAVTPAAFDAVLAALRRVFQLVVADITADLEGEREGGSIDVEERNHMARHTTAAADAVVVVGGPGAHGIRRLAGLVDELLDHGVDPARLVPVVNRAPAGVCLPRLCGLPRPTVAVPTVAGDGLLPGSVVAPVAAAVNGLLTGPPLPPPPALVPIVPGSLGCGIR